MERGVGRGGVEQWRGEEGVVEGGWKRGWWEGVGVQMGLCRVEEGGGV